VLKFKRKFRRQRVKLDLLPSALLKARCRLTPKNGPITAISLAYCMEQTLEHLCPHWHENKEGKQTGSNFKQSAACSTFKVITVYTLILIKGF
jgi:hypothetical protein